MKMAQAKGCLGFAPKAKSAGWVERKAAMVIGKIIIICRHNRSNLSIVIWVFLHNDEACKDSTRSPGLARLDSVPLIEVKAREKFRGKAIASQKKLGLEPSSLWVCASSTTHTLRDNDFSKTRQARASRPTISGGHIHAKSRAGRPLARLNCACNNLTSDKETGERDCHPVSFFSLN